MDHHFLRHAALGLGILLVSPSHAASFHLWAQPEQEVFHLVNLQRGLHGLSVLAADSRLHDAALSHSDDMSVNDFFSHTGSGGTNAGQRASAVGYDWNQPGGGWGENIAAGYGVTFVSGTGVTMVAPGDAARRVMYGTSDLNEISAYSVNHGQPAFASWNTVGTSWTGNLWDAWHTFKNGSGGWMGSSGHRNTILAGHFTDLGVGLVFDPNDQAFQDGSGPYYSYWTQNFAAGDTQVVPLPPAIWLFASAFALLGMTRRK
jgi:uncharacterized protein YkwD